MRQSMSNCLRVLAGVLCARVSKKRERLLEILCFRTACIIVCSGFSQIVDPHNSSSPYSSADD